MPPKSILKKPVNPRHLDVALHHANILEERKRVEGAVLDSIMALMDYPPSPTADPQRPASADAHRFCAAMICFQPADYDALVEERNIADRCGYAMCPRPKRRVSSSARKHFVRTASGVEMVDRKALEVWCSDDCAKRALYVKVQLNEEPAWMRQGGHGNTIELLVEDGEDQHKALPLRLKKQGAMPAPTDTDDDGVAAAWTAREDAVTALALERGEQPGQLSKANTSLIHDHITERDSSNAPPQPPSLLVQSIENATMAIEGHVPQSDRKDEDGEDSEDGQDDAHDWDKHLPG